MNHLSTFVVSGDYGCVLFSTKRSSLSPFAAVIAEDSSWRRDIKQVDESAFWYGFGSDVVSIPVSVYHGSSSSEIPQGAARRVEASFISTGERIYLHGLTDDAFPEWARPFI